MSDDLGPDTGHRATFHDFWMEHPRHGTILVMPACGMQVTSIRDQRTQMDHPAIVVASLNSAAGLVFVPTADELRALGTAMITQAGQIEARAADLLTNALKKRD